MYDEKNFIYILTILEAIEKIKIYSKEFDNPDDFLWSNQQINFNASVNLLIAIGEEVKKIDENLKAEYSEIKWKAIAGIRDKIAHDYRGIDPNIVWNVIQDDLDELKEVLIKMLTKVSYNQESLNEALESKFYTHLKYLQKNNDGN